MFKRLLLSLMIVAGSVYGAEKAVDAVSKFTPEVQQIVDEFREVLKAGSELSEEAFGQACGKLWKLRNSESLPISESENANALKHLLNAVSVKWAEERALYWAGVRSFACNMFNPYAYADAVKKTWQAGWGNMLTTLWTDHKSVLAGSALITTAGLFIAYKKGCFGQKEDDQNE